MTTLGDMIYEGAGPSATRLAIGTSGQILTVSGGIPSWQNAPASGVTTISFGSTGLTPSTATSGAVSVAGTLAIANGGTGSTSTTYCSLTSNVTGTLPATNGGTGQSSYAVGDLLFASTTTALSKLADVATGNALISGGVGVAPSYGKIGLTTHVSGTLPIANGGTNSTATPTTNGVAYGTGTAIAYTAAGTTGQVLTATTGGAPTWAAAGGSSFPAGTRMSFQQTSAPTGWTKDTTAAINDAILRLVTGSVTSGGTTAFSTWNAQTATGATTLSTSQIPSHTHGIVNDGAEGIGSAFSYGQIEGGAPPQTFIASQATGGGGSHTHSLTQSLKYYDFIIASKD
jgi:hypothetical protein